MLLAAESVNLFVKVGLVFASIDHFPLKASLIAFSELIIKSIIIIIILFHIVTPLLITGFIFSSVYQGIDG